MKYVELCVGNDDEEGKTIASSPLSFSSTKLVSPERPHRSRKVEPKGKDRGLEELDVSDKVRNERMRVSM